MYVYTWHEFLSLFSFFITLFLLTSNFILYCRKIICLAYYASGQIIVTKIVSRRANFFSSYRSKRNSFISPFIWHRSCRLETPMISRSLSNFQQIIFRCFFLSSVAIFISIIILINFYYWLREKLFKTLYVLLSFPYNQLALYLYILYI